MLQIANVLKSNFTSVAVLWLSNVQKMTIKTWTNVPDSSPEWWTYNALRLYCSKLNPACLCYVWFQTSKTSKSTLTDSTSQPSSPTAKSGKFALLSRAIKHSDIDLEVLLLQNRKSFENFFRFHRTIGISPKDLERFKADIAFNYTTFACSLAISTNLNFDLTFVTRNFIGSCFMRCVFWLVSRKGDCLERELRKSFWIKK